MISRITAKIVIRALHSGVIWIAACAFAAPKGLTDSDWGAIQKEYFRHRQSAVQLDGGWQAQNLRQNWSTYFDGRGFEVKPNGASWRWGLQLTTYGYRGQERSVTAAKPSADLEKFSYQWDSILREWYVNGEALEHGYTLAARPGNGSRLRFHLEVRGTLTPRVSADGRNIVFEDSGRPVVNYGGLKVTDAAGGDLDARFHVEGDGLRLEVDDSNAEYPITVDPFAQQAVLHASNPDAGDGFGSSVAIDGDLVVVGAPGERSNGSSQADNSLIVAGAAYVFYRDASGWTQVAYLKAVNPGPAAGDRFGSSVSISGHTIVVGAWGKTGIFFGSPRSGSGAAYVFHLNVPVCAPSLPCLPTDWPQEAYLQGIIGTSIASRAGDRFGWSVSVGRDPSVSTDGDTIVVGSPLWDGVGESPYIDSGSAFVYKRSGSTWPVQSYLESPTAKNGGYFGSSVAVNSNTVVVGELENGATGFGGKAYVFTPSGNAWALGAILAASNPGAGDSFGSSVAIDGTGNTVVVGAPFEDGNGSSPSDNTALDAGAAYVFTRPGTGWSGFLNQPDYLKSASPASNQQFGAWVAVSGDRIAVGGNGTGTAYVFRSGTRTPLTVNGPVAVSGDTVVVGTPADVYNGLASGAAYVFTDLTVTGNPPGIAKSFAAASVPVNGTTTLSFNITNPNPGVALSGVNFSDVFPAGLTVNNPSNVSGTCGGTVTATSGSNLVRLSGGSLAAGANCVISVTVKATTAGMKNNVTGIVGSTEGGIGNTASATLLVVAPPIVSEAFSPDAIISGGTVSLSFTIINPNPGQSLTGVGFNDVLPTGLVVATPSGLTGSCGGGTITATPETGSIQLSGATLAANQQCAFSVTILDNNAGATSSTNSLVVNSAEGGASAQATAGLTTLTAPTIAKSFLASVIPPNGTTTLLFTITNPNPTTTLTSVGFTDNFPAGLIVNNPNHLGGLCDGGAVTATPGSGSVSLSGGSITAGGQCVFSLTVQGTTLGTKNNITGNVTTAQGSGGTASATLEVVVLAPPRISKSFSPTSILVGQTSDLTFKIFNDNSNAGLTGVGFIDSLPPGVEFDKPPLFSWEACGGSASADDIRVILSNGSLPAGRSCEFSLRVKATIAGVKNNVTSEVASTEGGFGNTASATLTVQPFLPPRISKSFTPATILVGQTSDLRFTITNPNPNPNVLTSVAFFDGLPDGVVGDFLGDSRPCAGVVTAGSSFIRFGDGYVTDRECTFVVRVKATTAGVKNNVTSKVTSTEGGFGNTASATLTVTLPLPPTISKSFGATTVPIGANVSLSFTLSNPNPAPLTGVGFTDNLPGSLVVSNPNGLTGSCGGGTISAVPATAVISVSGATLPANSSCTFSVNVRATRMESLSNVTSPVTSTETGPGRTTTAFITIVGPPVISKSFTPATIVASETSALSFTIANPNPAVNLSQVGFTDILPTGVEVASPNGLTGSCGSGTISAGTGGVSLTNGTIPAGAICTFSVNVVGTTAGQMDNITTFVTSSEGGIGNAATAALTVLTPAQALSLINNQVILLNSAQILNKGQANSLTAELNQAIDSMGSKSPNNPAGCNQLMAFVNEVNGYVAGHILTPEQAGLLLGGPLGVNAIMSAVPCP